MNNPYIYYKDQCKYCLKKGKCGYQKKTQTFLDAINGIEHLVSGVYGSLNFRCDYLNHDELEYREDNTSESFD